MIGTENLTYNPKIVQLFPKKVYKRPVLSKSILKLSDQFNMRYVPGNSDDKLVSRHNKAIIEISLERSEKDIVSNIVAPSILPLLGMI